MNTNGLARNYGCLTPRERLPLIMAASGRGDETEWQRLMSSAPRMTYQVPDHFGLGMAFREVSDLHFMEVLHLAALYHQALASSGTGGEDGPRLLDAALVFGYLLKVKLAGWRAFCAELHLDPELCWSLLPGFEAVQRAEETADQGAFTAEEVVAWRQRKGGTPKAPTAEDVAAGLRKCLEARADWWK